MPVATKPATRRRAAEIIDAAAQVFATRGYHGASTQDIADVLGIRQASLYYYFPSKEAALEQVCMRGVEGFVEQAAAVASADEPAPEKLRQLILGHLTPIRDRQPYVLVFLRERHRLADEGRHRVGRLSRRYERIIQGVFEAGVRAGELRRDLDCRLAALGLLGMCNAAANWYGAEPGATIERIAAEFGTLIVGGAMPRRAPARRRPLGTRPRGR
jgi:AcrR family transcriptional regulator